jgi:hypothetical protein
MDHNFDVFVKEHLQEILCEAEKNHALSLLKAPRSDRPKQKHLKQAQMLMASDIQLQDCAVSPSFSQSHL